MGINWRGLLVTVVFGVVMYFVVFKWAIPLITDAGLDIGR